MLVSQSRFADGHFLEAHQISLTPLQGHHKLLPRRLQCSQLQLQQTSPPTPASNPPSKTNGPTPAPKVPVGKEHSASPSATSAVPSTQITKTNNIFCSHIIPIIAGRYGADRFVMGILIRRRRLLRRRTWRGLRARNIFVRWIRGIDIGGYIPINSW